MGYIVDTIAEIILNFYLFLPAVFACTKGNASYMVQTPLLNSEDRMKNFQEDQEGMVESIPNMKESTYKGGKSIFIKCQKKEIQDFSLDNNNELETDFVELSDVEYQLDLSDLEDYLTSDECIKESTYEWGMPVVELSTQSPEDTEVSYRHHYRSRRTRNRFSTYLYKSSSLENIDTCSSELSFTHQKGKEREKSRECILHLDDSEHQSSTCMYFRIPSFCNNVCIKNPQAQERKNKVFSDDLEFDDELESEGLYSSDIDSITSFGFTSFNCKSLNESINISHNVCKWNQRIPPANDELVDTDVNYLVDQICSTYEHSRQMSGEEAPNSTEYSEEKVRMWCPADPDTEEMVNVDVNCPVNPYMCIHGHSQNFSEKQEKKERSAGKSKKTWGAAVFPGFMRMEKDRPGKAKPKKRRNKSGRRRGETRRTRRSLREIINWQISLTRNTTTMYDVKIGTSSEQIALHQMAHGASNFESSGVEDTNGHMFEDGPRQSDNTENRQQVNSVQGLPNSKEQNREGKVSNSACLLNTPGAESLSYSSTETLSSFFSSVSLSSVEEDETYHYEWLRLKTFSNWPLNSIFSTTLAKNGWVALGQEDQARCYSCHVVHGGWKVGDNPEKYHEPNCRFLRGQSSNVPIFREQLSQSPTARQIHQDHQQRIPELSENQRSLDNVAQGFPVREEQSETQTDSLSSLGALSSSPRETQETNIATVSTNHNDTLRQQNYEGLPTTELVAAPTSRDNLPPISQYQNSAAAIDVPAPQSKEAQLEALKKDPMGINFDRPKYPTYAILAVRISSFTAWPASMTQTPRDMAIAGFFYAGYGDYTRCFFCGGGLRNWEPGDDPWVEHARWFMKCAFVRQNRGQDFIELVQRRAAELEEQKNQQGTGNTQPNTGEESAQAKEEKVMRSPAVTTIKEMGYSEERIKAAISVIKSRLPRGKHKVSAHDILEVIFELNQSESSSVINQSETVTEMSARNTDQSNSVMENSAYYSGHSNMSDEGKLKSANDPERSTEKDSLEEAAGGNSIPNPIFDELTSLKMENTSLKDQILCKICMEKNVSIAFLPCGHLACCEDCSPAMRKCPICRQFVRGTVKTFLV